LESSIAERFSPFGEMRINFHPNRQKKEGMSWPGSRLRGDKKTFRDCYAKRSKYRRIKSEDRRKNRAGVQNLPGILTQDVRSGKGDGT